MPDVDSNASVHPKAEIGENVEIGPFAVVGEHTKIGDNTKIGPHAVIEGWTTIGNNCKIFAGAVIGSDPQDLKFRGEESYVEVGDNTTIREYATVNRGTYEGETTSIGSSCLIMSYCHIAHNCVLEDRVIMSSFAGLAGHIYVEQHAIIGGLVGIHQFVRIGRNSIIGGCSGVRQDVLPYSVANGNPCRAVGINIVGLRRLNFSPERISKLKRAYKTMFRKNLCEKDAVKIIQDELSDDAEVKHILDFIEKSGRGLARP